jgi:hypothetical protein
LGDTYACDLRYTDGDLLIRVFGYAVDFSLRFRIAFAIST